MKKALTVFFCCFAVTFSLRGQENLAWLPPAVETDTRNQEVPPDNNPYTGDVAGAKNNQQEIKPADVKHPPV